MKKRFLISLVLLLVIIVLVRTTVLAYGNNLSFPAAQRFGISNYYSGSHQAYDYPFPNYTKVVAAKGGTVTSSEWRYADGWDSGCTGGLVDRGNYIILNHGNGLETWYFHLSNTGNKPGPNTTFYRGSYMALSDDNGCSDGPHLHFAAKLNGTPFDPYAGATDWVSGQPIPMGYRNQNGAVNGPYPLIDSKIQARWVAEEGKPGSPLGSKYSIICPQMASVQVTGYRQDFERGYIEYCGTSSAYYVGYAKTYLPDIRARLTISEGWNSTVVIRNDSSVPASVNITIYNSDGTVLDSRTHKTLGVNATWSVDIHSIVFDTSLIYPTGTFEGAAIVAASQNVSAMVINDHEGIRTDGYTGVPAAMAVSGVGTAITEFVPAYYCNYYGWSTSLYVQNAGTAQTEVIAYFYQDSGSEGLSSSATINPGGLAELYLDCGENIYMGSARVTASQPLAVIAHYENPSYQMSFSDEGLSGWSNMGYLPTLFKSYYGWMSSYQVQEAHGYPATVIVTYYPSYPGSSKTINLPAWGHAEVYMGGESALPIGRYSASLSVTGSGRIVTAIHHTNYEVMAGLGYHGFKAGARNFSLPYLKKNLDGWIASLAIQNVDTVNAQQVTVYFYNPDGSLYSSYPLPSLSPGYSFELYNEIPAGWYGSARVQSVGANVVAAVHQAHDDGRHFGYSAP